MADCLDEETRALDSDARESEETRRPDEVGREEDAFGERIKAEPAWRHEARVEANMALECGLQ